MKLSTALIVKNELENLKILIPIMDKFSDEIVIVDTGSTDGTYNFIKESPFCNKIVLKQINWHNNFAEARNESLKYSSKDFIFWLDADDRLDSNEVKKLIVLKNNFQKNNIYALKLFNESDYTYSYQLRIFPNFQNIKFKFPVHEQLDFNTEKFNISFEDITIIHTGYSNKNILKEKQLRNLSILTQYPNKTFYHLVQIAESYKILGNFETAIDFFNKAILITGKEQNKELVGFSLLELFKINILTNNFSNAAKTLEQAKLFSNYYPVIEYYIAREYFRAKDFKKSADIFHSFLKKHKNKKYLNPVPEKIEQSAMFFLAKSLFYLGNVTKSLELLEQLSKLSPENISYKNFKKKLEGYNND